jgi:hypothetical protein
MSNGVSVVMLEEYNVNADTSFPPIRIITSSTTIDRAMGRRT